MYVIEGTSTLIIFTLLDIHILLTELAHKVLNECVFIYHRNNAIYQQIIIHE